MTAIVLEVQNNNSIVLGEDGQVYAISRSSDDSVGKSIEFSAEQTYAVNRRRVFWRIATHVMILFVLVLLGLLLLFFSSVLPTDDAYVDNGATHHSLRADQKDQVAVPEIDVGAGYVSARKGYDEI